MSSSSDGNSSDAEDETVQVARNQLDVMQEFVTMASIFGMCYDATFMNKCKRRVPDVSGYDWVLTTLRNPTSCYDMFRMRPEIFHRLHNKLVSSYGLKSTKKYDLYRGTSHIFMDCWCTTIC
jgi:hypothetical protein